jgi:hypothetical protein
MPERRERPTALAALEPEEEATEAKTESPTALEALLPTARATD